MRLLLCSLFSLVFTAMPAAQAQESQAAPNPARAPATPIRAVIELFTSQGCNSCPPADALLKSYVDDDTVIALSLPVDYWDYIGWKDTLASPRHTDRQRAYARTFGLGPVYTPQVVVNGAAQALGSSRTEIDQAIQQTSEAFEAARVPVHFWYHGNTIIIETGAAPEGTTPKEATIWLAVVQKAAVVDIKHGENGGKSLTYYNVVRELTPVGLWNGRPAQIKLARGAIMHPESEKFYVLLQETETGLIRGAARFGG